jgi:hypothetical protein
LIRIWPRIFEDWFLCFYSNDRVDASAEVLLFQEGIIPAIVSASEIAFIRYAQVKDWEAKKKTIEGIKPKDINRKAKFR